MQSYNRFCSVNFLTLLVSRSSTVSKITSQHCSRTGYLVRLLVFFLIFIFYQRVAVAGPVTMLEDPPEDAGDHTGLGFLHSAHHAAQMQALAYDRHPGRLEGLFAPKETQTSVPSAGSAV